MSASSLNSSGFIQGYLDLSSRELDKEQFVAHKKEVENSIESKGVSKEAITAIMKTLLVGVADEGELYANEKSLDSIIERCNLFVKDHSIGDTGFVIGSDQELVGKISDIMFEVLQERPFKFGNTELSLILSAILLKSVKKPFFFLNASDREDLKRASVNNLAMRIFFAEKYKKHMIGDSGKILKAIEVYENASKYKDASGTYIVEWHGLNHAINEWKKLAQAKKE